MRFSYQILTRDEQFLQLKKQWCELIAQSAGCTFFLHWQWQYLSWKHFSGRLFIVTVYEQKSADLLAIFPLIKSQKTGFHQLNFIASPYADYLDVIIKKGNEAAVLAFFFNVVLPERKEIGAVQFDALREGSATAAFLKSNLDKRFQSRQTYKPCPYIALPQTWEAYENTLTRSMRLYLRRKSRKLHKDFQVNIAESQVCELPKRMQQFITQHQLTWNQRQKPGAFANADFATFHQTIAPYLLQEDKLCLMYLELNGQPVASYYLFKDRQRVLYYLSGYDPAYAKYSPAVVLLAAAIQTAIRDGFQEFDLMRGSGAYKYQWTDRQRHNENLLVWRNTLQVRCYFLFMHGLQILATQFKQRVPWRYKNRLRALLPKALIRLLEPLFRSA